VLAGTNRGENWSKGGWGTVRLSNVDTWELAEFQNHNHVNMKLHINWFWNPANSLVSTSDNITGPTTPLLQFFPLVAPANTGVSLPPQLMTFYLVSSWSADSRDVYCQEPGRCCSLSFLLTFYLSRFSFYINTMH